MTTDRLDNVRDGLGTQVGQTRLWRLRFDDIATPDLGGTGRGRGTEQAAQR